MTRLDDKNFSVDKEYDSSRNIQGLVKASEQPTNILKSTYETQDLFTVESTLAIKNWVWTFVPEKETTKWARQFSDNIKVFKDDTSKKFTIRYVKNTSITPPRAGAFIEGHLVAKQGNAVIYTSKLILNISFEGRAISIWTPKEFGWPLRTFGDKALAILRKDQNAYSSDEDPMHLVPPTSDNLDKHNIFHLRPFRDKAGTASFVGSYLLRVDSEKGDSLCLKSDAFNGNSFIGLVKCSTAKPPQTKDSMAFHILLERDQKDPFNNTESWKPEDLNQELYINNGWYFINKENDDEQEQNDDIKLVMLNGNQFHQKDDTIGGPLETSYVMQRSSLKENITRLNSLGSPLFYIIDSANEGLLKQPTFKRKSIPQFTNVFNWGSRYNYASARTYKNNGSLYNDYNHDNGDPLTWNRNDVSIDYIYLFTRAHYEGDSSKQLVTAFNRPKFINLAVTDKKYQLTFKIDMEPENSHASSVPFVYYNSGGSVNPQLLNEQNTEVLTNRDIDGPFNQCDKIYGGRVPCSNMTVTFTTNDFFDKKYAGGSYIYHPQINTNHGPVLYERKGFFSVDDTLDFRNINPLTDTLKLTCSSSFDMPTCSEARYREWKVKEYDTKELFTKVDFQGANAKYQIKKSWYIRY